MPFDWDARADCTAWFCKANVAYITVEKLCLHSFGASLVVRGPSLLVGADGLGAVYFYT
jgi:hypothetical protein